MPRTRAQTKKLKSRRKSYRRRVKNSKCRGLTRTCRVSKGCRMTKSGKKKAYCRKVKNTKVRSLKGGSRRSRRAGSVIGDAAVPLALVALNHYYKPKGKKMLSRKKFSLKGGKKYRKTRKSRKGRKGGKKSRKSRKGRKSRKSRK